MTDCILQQLVLWSQEGEAHLPPQMTITAMSPGGVRERDAEADPTHGAVQVVPDDRRAVHGGGGVHAVRHPQAHVHGAGARVSSSSI